jgi:hypothetical protein
MTAFGRPHVVAASVDQDTLELPVERSAHSGGCEHHGLCPLRRHVDLDRFSRTRQVV